MSLKTISREEITLLKNKRKKKIKRIYISIISFLLVCGISVGTYFYIDYYNENSKGKELEFKAQASIGNSDNTVIPYEAMSDYEGISINQTSTDATDSDVQIEDSSEQVVIDFTVPETSLPPVEEIEGNDWYNEDLYVKHEGPIDFSYFNNSVFIGDSRTEGMILYGGIPNLNAFCYKGLSIDKLDSLQEIYVPGEGSGYTCFEAIEMTKYDNYYCMFGVNELGWVYLDVFIEYFNELIEVIKEANPDATIYVQSVLPVSEYESGTSDVYTQDRVMQLNTMLIEMCQSRNDVIYLDTAASVTGEDGFLPEEAATDGIHCNADYCKRMLQYIRYHVYDKK